MPGIYSMVWKACLKVSNCKRHVSSGMENLLIWSQDWSSVGGFGYLECFVGWELQAVEMVRSK